MGATYTHTVILSNPTTQNPFTVASNGLVSVSLGDGILGTAGFAWTLSNFGTIEASAAAGDGIDLTAGGLVINGQSGSSGGFVSGNANGVLLGATATVVNYGTITGRYDGIDLSAGGTITNNGTINGGVGAYSRGGTIVNSGTIGGTIGAFVSNGVLTNYGKITGSPTGTAGAILTNGARLTNGASGSMTGLIAGNVGIYFDLATAPQSTSARSAEMSPGSRSLRATSAPSTSSILAQLLPSVARAWCWEAEPPQS